MGRRSKVQRTAEEKYQIVMEGLKSGNTAETCRKHEIAPTLYYRWKDEAEKLGGKELYRIGGVARGEDIENEPRNRGSSVANDGEIGRAL